MQFSSLIYNYVAIRKVYKMFIIIETKIVEKDVKTR